MALYCLRAALAGSNGRSLIKRSWTTHPPYILDYRGGEIKKRGMTTLAPSKARLPDISSIDESKGEDALVDLAAALINIESVSGREQHMAIALKGWLEARGWVVQLQAVEQVDELVGEVKIV